VDVDELFPPVTPSVSANRTTTRVLRSHASYGCNDILQADADRLGFLPLAEWDEYSSFEEDIPSHLRYSIEWKIAVNNGALEARCHCTRGKRDVSIT
jgi:hypothetical protein